MTGRWKQSSWIVPLVIAGMVALFGWWGNARLRETVEEQLRAKLTSTLNANVTALEIWTTNQTRQAMLLAEEREVRQAALRLLERGPASPGEDFRRLPSPDRELVTVLGPQLRMLAYESAQLVNTNFIVVAGPGRGRQGQPVHEAHTNKFAELFSSGEPIIITPFKPEFGGGFRFPSRGWRGRTNEFAGPGGPGNRGGFRGRGSDFQRRRGDYTMMQVAAPVRDYDQVIRGALALIINPTNEFTRILSVARMGETGETYAFDQTGLLISQSRFDDQLRTLGLLDATNASSALSLRLHDPGGDLTKGFQLVETNLPAQPLIGMVMNAVLQGDEGWAVQPSRDYRGVPVVGAWRWLPDLGFGVVTQIDAREAYRPLRVLQLLFTSLFLLLVLSSIVMFLFSFANATWRRRLSEAELKLKQLGQYTLEEKIGEGGMGVVYRARHALMRRDTAVKLLMPDRADADSIARFEREVVLTCQLTHPNTIQVFDYGHTPEGIFYYAMEYLRGLNLHQLVARFGPQPEGRVIHLLAQVCDSLAEAHALGLVHRDIKPGNVFLCERGGVPDSVKVLDFGLVRHFGPKPDAMHVTAAEGFVGTPWFMPPEAIKNSAKTDPRSDLYAVGAVGYFLMTGKYIFEAKSVMEIYEQQLTAPVPPLSRRTSCPVSVEFEHAIQRCLDKDPERRPQSAGELRELLLSSPLSADWQPAARAAWWAQYRSQIQSFEKDFATPAAPTIKIDFASRIEPQDQRT